MDGERIPEYVLVSAVIPAFNAERFIEEAVSSVLSQTHPNIELIVVDDGSQDRTKELAEASGATVISGPNEGLAHARNKGRKYARGEALAWLDADDVWDPNKIEVQLQELCSNLDLVAVGSLLRYETLDGRRLGTTGMAADAFDPRLQTGELLPCSMSSLMFWKEALDEVGGSDETLDADTGGWGEDVDLVARIARLGGVRCLPIVLGGYRVHGSSMTTSSQRGLYLAAAYVRERLHSGVSWDDFSKNFEWTLAKRREVAVGAWQRRFSSELAGRRYVRAGWFAVLSTLFAPGDTLHRAVNKLRLRRDP